MYTSPIEKIYGEVQTQIVQEDEKMVMKAIREVGVNVDKETLIKALQYDRNQYTKGYEDGKNDVLDKISAVINTPNRGTCDYFIVDRIEEIINMYKREGEGK